MGFCDSSARAALLGLGAFVFSLTAGAALAGPTQTGYKFYFGAGDAPPGYTRVAPTQVYSDKTGFGFEKGAKIDAVRVGGADPLHAGYATSDKPFYFSAAVPEGNYRVTFTLGDPNAAADATIKAELRRLMLQEVRTAPGQFASPSIIVNVRTPEIYVDGKQVGKVHLKAPRETTDEAWDWDDRLTLEINGLRPCLCAIDIEKVNVPTVYILGDSTVCDQSREPWGSWGQFITRFFKPDIAVSNNAESGETLKSSTGAHRLQKVLSVIKPGDYLLIQYGHNDMKSKDKNAPQQYKKLLTDWVEQVQAKGATAIVITPMNRHSFRDGVVVNSLNEYPGLIREVAAEQHAPLIDLNAMSKTLYEALGQEGSLQLFALPAGSSTHDNTHHSPYGAYELAKCVIEGIRQDRLDLAGHIVADDPSFDPSHPDAAANVRLPPSPLFSNERPLGIDQQ